jgi:hypothetical protein
MYAGFLNNLSDIRSRGTDKVNALKNIAPDVITLFGVKDLVEGPMRFITICIGAAIVTSFLALFMLSNEVTQLVWPLFFLVVGLMTAAADYYYGTWKSLRWLSDRIDSATLHMEHAIDIEVK